MALSRSFRRLVFAQAMLAMIASCLAEANIGLLLATCALGALAWFVMESGETGENGLPRWAVTLGLLLAMLLLPFEIHRGEGRNLIEAIAHFTLWLQLLLLLGRKAHQDYPPIMVLSMLQMLAASLLGPSLIFGVLLLAYCLLALVTVLVYQLKSVGEQVREHHGHIAPPGSTSAELTAPAGPGFRWQFRLAALTIAVICGASGAATFALMPRHEPTPLFASLVGAENVRQVTGFSPTVKLQGAPLASGSQTPVLTVRVFRPDGAALNAAEAPAGWLLRGATLDVYDSATRTWSPGRRDYLAGELTVRMSDAGVQLLDVPDDVPQYRFDCLLLVSRLRSIFQIAPVSFVHSMDLPSLQLDPLDGQLSQQARSTAPVRYTQSAPLARAAQAARIVEAVIDEKIVSRPTFLRPFRRMRHWPPEPPMPTTTPTGWRTDLPEYAAGWLVQSTRVRRLTLSVLHEAGLVLDADAPTPSDPLRGAALARAMQTYLAGSGHYTYSLDVPISPPEADPIIDFLFEHKRGHCELFASALAAMARSVGMRARVATGYRASEFNNVGGYYVVRDSQAHAWTEIEISPHVWMTFDASPPGDVTRLHQSGGWFLGLQHLYEHLEYAWSRKVMGFNDEARERTVSQIRAAGEPGGFFAWLNPPWQWLKNVFAQFQRDLLTQIVVGVIFLFLVIAIASLIYRLMVRRRRLIALQLTCLPRQQRRMLARQLGFYLMMLEMLERRGHVRPSWQSPFGFAQQLVSDGQRFEPVVALTELFYEIRFGYRRLNDERKQRVRAQLRLLERALAHKA